MAFRGERRPGSHLTFTHELRAPLVGGQVDADGDDLVVERLLSLLVDHVHELRDAVRVHEHGLEAVVHADVIQDGDDGRPVALRTFSRCDGETSGRNMRGLNGLSCFCSLQ